MYVHIHRYFLLTLFGYTVKSLFELFLDRAKKNYTLTKWEL